MKPYETILRWLDPKLKHKHKCLATMLFFSQVAIRPSDPRWPSPSQSRGGGCCASPKACSCKHCLFMQLLDSNINRSSLYIPDPPKNRPKQHSHWYLQWKMPFYDHSLHYYHAHKNTELILDIYVHVYICVHMKQWNTYLYIYMYIHASARAASDLFLLQDCWWSSVCATKMLYLQGSQKASSKTKPLHSVTYDYSTEWVWCGKVSKTEGLIGPCHCIYWLSGVLGAVLTALVGSRVPCRGLLERSLSWNGSHGLLSHQPGSEGNGKIQVDLSSRCDVIRAEWK